MRKSCGLPHTLSCISAFPSESPWLRLLQGDPCPVQVSNDFHFANSKSYSLQLWKVVLWDPWPLLLLSIHSLHVCAYIFLLCLKRAVFTAVLGSASLSTPRMIQLTPVCFLLFPCGLLLTVLLSFISSSSSSQTVPVSGVVGL